MNVRDMDTGSIRARLNEALFDILGTYSTRIKTDLTSFRPELSGVGDVTAMIDPMAGKITFNLYNLRTAGDVDPTHLKTIIKKKLLDAMKDIHVQLGRDISTIEDGNWGKGTGWHSK